MATAVSMWSPVIMTGRMPASLASAMAGATSGRSGSIMPERPTKTRSCSSASGLQSVGSALCMRTAEASTRSAWLAMSLLAAMIFSRRASVRVSTVPSAFMTWVQRPSTTSGPPLVYCSKVPSGVFTTTDIILRPESNGASPTRS